MDDENYETLEPTLDFYKLSLRMINERLSDNGKLSDNDIKLKAQLVRYINSQERK